MALSPARTRSTTTTCARALSSESVTITDASLGFRPYNLCVISHVGSRGRIGKPRQPAVSNFPAGWSGGWIIETRHGPDIPSAAAGGAQRCQGHGPVALCQAFPPLIHQQAMMAPARHVQAEQSLEQ